ncbi:MAG TPA: hypothetical protein VFI03_01015 [Solirubrobacterales bacterium]|nr:hypothetical protein [Solirubrobacterales bacterium]
MKISVTRHRQTTSSVEIVGPAAALLAALAVGGALLFWSITRGEAEVKVVCPVHLREEVIRDKNAAGTKAGRIAQRVDQS